jgi:hypothetical protein
VVTAATVSQRAKEYFGRRNVKRVTLDFDKNVKPDLGPDPKSEVHMCQDLMDLPGGVKKFVESMIAMIRAKWGATAFTFVWASPDCSRYSTAKTDKFACQKGQGFKEADELVERTFAIIKELQCYAAKVRFEPRCRLTFEPRRFEPPLFLTF